MSVLVLLMFFACESSSPSSPPPEKTVAPATETKQTMTERGINVLFISLDTVSADHMSLYGGQAEVPNLEKLGRSGVVYTNAYTHFPETAISHWTMMTGVLPDVHGNVPANGTSRYKGPTLAERLRNAGYDTAAFIGGETLTDRSTGLSRGFNLYDDQHAWNREDLKRPGADIAKRSIEWIQGKQKLGKAYFAFVHFFDAHFPYTPAPPWDKKYNPDYAGTLTGSDADLMPFRDGKKTPSPSDIAHVKALYDGEISELDAIIAPLIDQANDGNTVIVVTSDHGESFGHNYWFNHRDGLWDEITNVPLIIAGPNVPTKKRVGALTGLIDITPTILDVLDMEPLEQVNGTTTTGVWTTPVYRPAIFSITDPERPKPQIAKRTLQHKLIAVRGAATGSDTLRYDFKADPKEQDSSATLNEHFSDIETEYKTLVQPIIKKWQGAAPTPKKAPTAEEHERLKALGYVDEPAKAPTPK